MLEEELVKLVEKIQRERCEGQRIELKSANRGRPERLYDTLSSFANQQGGGIIVFGVDEKSGYKVCGVYDPQDLMVKVAEQAKQMEPVVRPLFTVVEIAGVMIVAAEIAECDEVDKPCFYRGKGRMRGAYVRVGDADEPMSEYEVYSYEAFRRKVHDELEPAEDAVVNNLDDAAVERYFSGLRVKKKNLATLDRAQIMELQGFVRKGCPTIAGLLLFGLYPQAAFPQLCVTAVRVPGVEIGDVNDAGARFLDNKRIEGTIPDMLEEAVDFVRSNMRVATIVDPQTAQRCDRAEYPLVAVRELILNALVHRDYSRFTQNAPIRIAMFEDRLEVESPGGLYGRLTIDKLGKVTTDTRNPVIAGVMEVFGLVENRFSGIPTVRKVVAASGMPEPEFRVEHGGNFIATIRKFAIPRRNVVAQAGMLCEEQDVAYGDAISFVPASGGAQRHASINMQVETRGGEAKNILDFCAIPRSRAEISAFLGIASVPYMQKTYLNPLVESGQLQMLLPQKPRSGKQRFYASGNNAR